MAKEKYQSLRLQEFNNFDIERLLKTSVDSIDVENDKRLKFIEEYQTELSPETITSFADSVENNTAEILQITSILHHTDDIYSYFSKGPLFRKDRDR